MSCGLPLDDLLYLADALLDPHAGFATPPPLRYSATGEGSGVRAQLYQMYGDGQIGEEVFTALRALADRGQLRPADLAVHRAHARHRPANGSDAAVANALRSIRSRLAQLAHARAASEKVLAELEARLAGLDERIAGKEQGARDIIQRDEDVARQRLAEKAELSHSRDQLAMQAQALRADLARLDDLRAQLEIKAAELEAMQARSHLAEEVLK